MTVSTEISQEVYVGNGVTSVFPYRFRILKASNMVVVTVDQSEVEHILVLDTDFSVSGVGGYAGGNVTLPNPLPEGWGLILTRELPAVQETDLRNQGTFFAETHEDAFDYLTMLIQQAVGWLGLALMRPTVKSNLYDAKQYRIGNLADPVNDMDAVNNRSMRGYVESMVAGVVGGFGWFIQVGVGAVYRTFQDKMRDTVSIKDFGVKMDGVTDDTTALTLAFTSGLKVELPKPKSSGEFCLVTDTVLFASNTTIIGPGSDVVAIRASNLFANDKDILSSRNYHDNIQMYDENISISNLCIDANGWGRALSDSDSISTGISLGHLRHSQLVNVRVINSPRWNFKVNSFNPYVDLGHAGIPLLPSYNILIYKCISEDFIHGDGLIVQGSYGVKIVNYTQLISSTAKTLHTYIKSQAAIQIVDGSHDVVVTGAKTFGNGTMLTAYSTAGHTLRPAVYNVDFNDVFARGVHSLVSAWNDPSTDVTFASDQWLGRNINVNSGTLIKPTLDISNNNLPARLVDFQHQMHCHANDVNVVVKDIDDTYSSPVAISHFFDCVDATIDGMSATKVPGIPTGTYTITRNIGWINSSTTAGSKNLRIRNINLNNIGYINRVISDTTATAVKEARNIRVDAIPSDGQTKTGIYSASLDIELANFNTPVGMEKFRVGQFFTSYPYDNVKVSLNYGGSAVIGGMLIRAESNAGVQNVAGILFDRAFVSSSDPTGALGKGSISFRTSAATSGTFSITAYHEDISQYRPIVMLESTAAPFKSFTPVIDNDTVFGKSSARIKEVYAAIGAINTSDAREKTPVRKLLDVEISIGLLLADEIGTFGWLDSVVNKQNNARIHFGLTVQRAIEIFEAHAVDPFIYGAICYDSWEENTQITPAEFDENGVEISPESRIVTPAGDRYSFRPDQINLLISGALKDNQEKIEKRLLALEGKIN
ncbi:MULTISPECIES: glycosyl hydrolase family 28-related protein [Yersinia]|uniref:Tail fiber n=1 Tax=Yersinia frederiksenii TaxID=29484 RepID=A0AAI8ZNC5_YERFR|nr:MULTISPECIES: glycosyl hydrolase family 28-related protein [Yersinia]MDN0126853.1 glycosyl hydrolase family 28-related protein [Yersinia massiliensis]CFQ88108.1 Tail fiber [Yersinia frederiksenii]